ncbi:MAG: hypothetical protein E7564_05445 [Ruminococcaceae bacterium]|nr:hypothetical protein [Oscillospiraceae bacterium]
MTNREKFLNYVKNGGNELICSPQIGAGAGFDTRLANKTWMTQTTMQDTINATKMFDMVPLYNFGLPALSSLTSEFKEESTTTISHEGKRRTIETTFSCKKGTLRSKLIDEELKGCCPTEFFVKDEEDLKILDYFLDALLEVKDFSLITESVKESRKIIGDDNVMDVQWAMQPYELLGFPSTMDTAILAMEAEDPFRVIMDKIMKLDEHLIKATAKGGSDFVFLGGPGSEMISPTYYEEFLVPYSKIVTEMAHKEGLLIYSHICSPIEPMLTKGYYNQMGIDLFETLSPYPVGNVKSIEDAFSKLSPEICTRGNIGLDSLLNETPEQIYEKAWHILEMTKKMGRKHILAASDYMFYDTKTENVHAMCKATRDFNEKNK